MSAPIDRERLLRWLRGWAAPDGGQMAAIREGMVLEIATGRFDLAQSPEDEARAVVEAAKEVWASVPASYSKEDPMVSRHARALNVLGDAVRAYEERAHGS